MSGQQCHRFDQRLNDKEILLVLRIGELQLVDQLGDAMLDLDAGIDFHEVVAITVDDTLEGRCRVEADCDAEALGLLFHPLEHLEVGLQCRGLGLESGFLGLLDFFSQGFLGHGDFQQFLLVHLQGAVAAAEGDRPLAVAEQLDLVVAGLFDVQFDQDVLVVTDPVRLDFEQDFADQLRGL